MFIAHPPLSRTTMNRAGESRPEFTPRQGQYLAFIHAYTLVNGRSPAQIDVKREKRVTPPTVHQMLLTLEKAFLMTRQPGVARSIDYPAKQTDLPTLDPLSLHAVIPFMV